MGSSYFGRPKMGSSSSSSSSFSSLRKGKKNNSEKPRQPQRGLGVAQLEKLRLHGEISPNGYQYPNPSNQEDVRMQSSSPSFSHSSPASSASYGYHPSMMMGLSEYERAGMRYGDSQPSTTASWNPSHGIIENQHFAQPSIITRHLLNLHVEDSNPKQLSNTIGSSPQNTESSDTEELDLELRLSL